MSGFVIKIIAFIFMVMDHSAVLFPEYIPLWFRFFGRFSFPVFAFFIAEGMKKTKSPERYMLRLGALAVISEIPYDICFGNGLSFITHMNIVWTLLFGAILIYIIRLNDDFIIKAAYGVCLILGGRCLGLDYGAYGVLLIALYYVLGGRLKRWLATAAVFTVKWRRLIYPLNIFTAFWFFSCCGFLLPCLYNGERGKEPKRMFYILYLGHIIVLIGIKLIMRGFL